MDIPRIHDPLDSGSPRFPDIRVYVNGYGAPLDPLTDEYLDRYLRGVIKEIDPLRPRIRAIYLCGGYTNDPKMSEAQAMWHWFEEYAPDWVDVLHKIEHTDTVKDNLDAFAKHVGIGEFAALFGEYSRRFTLWMHGERLFRGHLYNGFGVVGIPFAKDALRWRHQLAQILFHLPVECLALSSPTIAAWKRRARDKHIARSRATRLNQR